MQADSKIYVHAATASNPFGETDSGQYRILEPDFTPPDLKPVIKKLYGKTLRQASNLVEMGVVGALTLQRQHNGSLPATTRLYLATGMGDITKNLKLFNQVSPPVNGLAAPFDFINSSANTTGFYVAKLLGLEARNLTISQDEFSFESALQIAFSDLASGDCQTALVGGVDETPNTGCVEFLKMARQYKLVPGQGSGWLFLSNNSMNAIGEISRVIKVNTDNSMDKTTWAESVFSAIKGVMDLPGLYKIVPGYRMKQSETGTIAELAGGLSPENYIQYCGAFYTASAFGIARILNIKHQADTHYLHIMKNETGATMCVLLRCYSHQ